MFKHAEFLKQPVLFYGMCNDSFWTPFSVLGSYSVCLCGDMQVCYRKSLGGGQSRDPGDDRHDISPEEVLTDPELDRHEGFQDEGEGKWERPPVRDNYHDTARFIIKYE